MASIIPKLIDSKLLLALNKNLLLKSLPSTVSVLIDSNRTYAAASKKEALTESQAQLRKHAAELGFKEKTSIKGTLFEYHDVNTSMKYMESAAFKKAYGEKLIWEWYIRNFKGQMPRKASRKQCIVNSKYNTGNPCPICRDPYLVVDYRNLQLLRHFVSPHTGRLFPMVKTGVCRNQHENLEIAYLRACDHGFIDHHIPDRIYNYEDYYQELKDTNISSPSVLLGVVIGANRKNINEILENLKEEDIKLK